MNRVYLDYDILIEMYRGMSEEEVQEKYQVIPSDINRIKEQYQEEMLCFYEIKKLIDEKRLKDAYNLCNQFPDFAPIQSQKINILLKIKHFPEALALCEKFPLYEPIQSQKVKILMKQKRWKKAIDVCDKFPDSLFLQSQKVKIFNRIGKRDEALAICDKFSNEEYFQRLKKDILTNRLDDEDKVKYKSIRPIKELLRNIDTISEDDIWSLDAPRAIQCLLFIAYYEKNNYPEKAILNFIKKEATMLPEDTIKAILNHLKQKGKIFDQHFYLHLIKLCLIHIEQASLGELKDELVKKAFLNRPNQSR